MSREKSFWKTLPLGSSLLFLLGVFFLFGTFACAGDLAEMGCQSALRLALSILISGLFAVSYAVAGFALRRQFWKAFLPLFAVHFTLINVLPRLLPASPQPAQMGAAEIARLHHRLLFEGFAIMSAVSLGYACFLYVTITQGRRYFRAYAEIELATEIHQVLVPAIETRCGGYEFYGRSSPSGEVGGDLIDLAGSEDHWVASPETRTSRREVPLAAAVVRELKNLYSRSAEHSQDALVFSKNQSLPLAADNLKKKTLRTACKRAGLQRIDWHTLRHTHGTLLHSQGTPLKVAQAQLGHSHMATTLEIYTHASGSAQRDAVNSLEEQLFPNVPKFESCGSITETEVQLVQ